jgi:hypothetical protein
MLLYIIVKFLAYVFWSYIGISVIARLKPSVRSAIGFGVIRVVLGMFFGIAVFLFFRIDSTANIALTYFSIYTPVRIVEWGIIAYLIFGRVQKQSVSFLTPQTIAWIAGGIAVSFLSDWLSPQGLAGSFCVGRCLC